MKDMKCDNCGIREASVRYSENINGVKRELHLCENCSKELGMDQMNFSMPIDFSSFFAGMLEEFQNTDFIPMFENVKEVQCKSCGYRFEDILNTGKLGCANCYDTFESRLDPIIRKIQGSNKHVGRLGKIKEHKVNHKPEVSQKKTIQQKEKTKCEQLKEELKIAIKEERYEDAAVLRDKIAKQEHTGKKDKKEE